LANLSRQLACCVVPACSLCGCVERRPKLWKHHGAHAQALAIQGTAASMRPSDRAWLADRYPGGIDSEWLHPKALEVFDEAPDVFEAAEVFVEAGDWLVWQLVTGGGGTGGTGDSIAGTLTRSSCFAGYKACFVSSAASNPDAAFFDAVRPSFGTELAKRLPEMRGGATVIKAPGDCAGQLHPAAARRLLSGLALPGASTPCTIPGGRHFFYSWSVMCLYECG
jgi:L-ribulokinase